MSQRHLKTTPPSTVLQPVPSCREGRQKDHLTAASALQETKDTLLLQTVTCLCLTKTSRCLQTQHRSWWQLGVTGSALVDFAVPDNNGKSSYRLHFHQRVVTCWNCLLPWCAQPWLSSLHFSQLRCRPRSWCLQAGHSQQTSAMFSWCILEKAENKNSSSFRIKEHFAACKFLTGGSLLWRQN